MRAIEARLRQRIKDLEAELSECKVDREKFRDDLIRNLKSTIRLHGENKYWSTAVLIESFAKQISGKVRWYW